MHYKIADVDYVVVQVPYVAIFDTLVRGEANPMVYTLGES